MQQLQKTTLTSLLAHYEPLVIAGLVFVAHLVLRAAVLLTYRLADAGPGAARPALAATLGLGLALTALCRTAGVVLLAAVLVALVLERRPWREVALCAGVALVPLAVWHFVHAAAVARGP